MTIHSGDPFATPEELRSPVRRLRGRLPAAVTLWTTYHEHGVGPVGLTVSSTVVVEADPGRVLGVLDEESELWEALRTQVGHPFVVAPLRRSDGGVADIFAGLMPAPGGPFAGRGVRETDWGPVLDGVSAWAGCHWDAVRPVGWSLLVEASVDHVEIIDDSAVPLVHYRGRYLGSSSWV